MKSVFQVTVMSGAEQLTRVVLAQPTDGQPADIVACRATLATAGQGAVGQSATRVCDIDVEATAGGNGLISVFAIQPRPPAGVNAPPQMFPQIFVTANASGGDAPIIRALAEAVIPNGGVMQSISKVTDVDIDATV